MTDNTYIVAALHEHRDSACITEQGLDGADRKNPDRPISLMSLDARQQVDASAQRGRCYRRFTADITLDCEQMPPTGSVLQCGKLTLVILPERKKCWPDCELWQEGLPCPLRDGVRYASVASPGKLCLGDAFITSQAG
jgi:hypothetical protein